MEQCCYSAFPRKYGKLLILGFLKHTSTFFMNNSGKFLYISREGENQMSIRIFVTGGTFDKEYNEITGELFFKDTHLHEMLALGRNKADVQVRTLMMIDSLAMDNADRKIILDNCEKASEDKIIITHGTDTMEDTARVLAQANLKKTIILIGAMIPYKFGSSDGLFNLGSAVAFVQTLPPGVYIAMNGKYFSADRVKKNKKTGEFEEI
jgi:L-asparaginase